MRHGALEKMSFVESDHAICAVTRSGAGGGEPQCPADHYATSREHTLTVVCGKCGSVRANGQAYTDEYKFTVERLGTFKMEAVHDTVCHLSRLMAHPSGGVSISSKVFTIYSTYEDETFNLRFARAQIESMVSPEPTISPITAI